MGCTAVQFATSYLPLPAFLGLDVLAGAFRSRKVVRLPLGLGFFHSLCSTLRMLLATSYLIEITRGFYCEDNNDNTTKTTNVGNAFKLKQLLL